MYMETSNRNLRMRRCFRFKDVSNDSTETSMRVSKFKDINKMQTGF